ncbi:heavy metal translocating P-type ATPase [Qipengyuania sp.]|uniref:heavy metal translocating P-type ATPase n=1 Tax=Qipengyuania sp. TaxID=2004515 RepID=UPI0035185E52
MANTRQLLAIEGLFCGGCARGLENRLRSLDGVRDAGVHYLTASAYIDWDPSVCTLARINGCIAAAGYRMIERFHLPDVLGRMHTVAERLTNRLAIAAFFAMWSMGAASVLYFGSGVSSDAAWWLAVASGASAGPALWAGHAIIRMGWRSLRLRTYNIDTLIAAGVLGAVLISGFQLLRGSATVYFDAAAMLLVLRLVGQWIEARTRANSIAALIEMEAAAPETAWRASGGDAVPISQISVGDRIRIPAGAPVTIDGLVLEGTSRLNTAFLSGESAPRSVQVGDYVEAGSLNLDRQLIIRVARSPDDRLIDRMGGRVALELAAKGEPSSVDDTVMTLLAKATPVLAMLAFALGLVQGTGIVEALARALTILIVICPCALAIARPLASLVVVGFGRKAGLRIADPASLDSLARPGSVVFDKTGTLTSGELEVAQVFSCSEFSKNEILALAARAETGIEHPIARAIVSRAGESGPGGLRLARKAIGEDGSGRRVEVTGMPSPVSPQSKGTFVEVRLDDVAVGEICLVDRPDRDVIPLINALRSEGIELRMATGDSRSSAQDIGEAVGLGRAEIEAGQSPLDKADLVRNLPKPVLFVGDGINDAPAMAAADCSISVSRAHAAAAASASIAIVEGGLGKISDAMSLARRFRTTGRRNAALALGYNGVVIPLALGGAMSPLLAALTMTASSLLAIANSIRLGR